MDNLSQPDRSRRMAMIRSKHSKPELAVRKLIHSLGFRYRLHGDDLPGKPDLVFRSRRKVIFVHGCFWHRHSKACPLTRMPKSKLEFWGPKLEENRRRDRRNMSKLAAAGWRSLIIWECQLGDLDTLSCRVTNS